MSMKHIKNLRVRIIAAVAIGLLFAYIGVGITHVTRPCAPADVPKGESISRCVSIEKVYAHPSDIFTNKQDKLIHFSETFVAASFISYAILSIFSSTLKKPKPATRPKG